jgi:hypothetical protein
MWLSHTRSGPLVPSSYSTEKTLPPLNKILSFSDCILGLWSILKGVASNKLLGKWGFSIISFSIIFVFRFEPSVILESPIFAIVIVWPVYINMYIYTCIYVYIHMYAYICMWICMSIMYKWIYVYMDKYKSMHLSHE